MRSAITACQCARSLCLALLVAMCFCSFYAQSQEPAPEPDISARELIEKNQQAEQLVEEKASVDARAIEVGATPLATVLGLREALRARDYERAGQYLDRRYLPDELEAYGSEQLIRALQYVWNRQNIADVAAVSDDPEGDLRDGLPRYRDQIGSVTISSGIVPIYLQRVPDGEGGLVWKLSNATVARIPEMWEELGYSPVAVFLSRLLPEGGFMGMENWQLLATFIFFLLAWPLAVLASLALLRLALLIPNRFREQLERFFKVPFRIFLFIQIARLLIDQLGLSLAARILLESSGMDYVAYTILLLGFISLWRDYQISKLQAAGNTQYLALLRPFTTMVKIIVVTVVALFWARSAGYDMSTILAGLGVGSLAVALAAQKTLENVIGAVTLYTARPVNVGDFCRFGSVVGTVEEIGLRSTLIRTLERTMVVIPNSVFASQEIENFSRRDRIRYFRKVRLQLCPADTLRTVLEAVRRLFASTDALLPETISIRLENIEDGTAMLRIDAGVTTTDYQRFLEVAEQLNLGIIEAVESAGAALCGPEQLVQLQRRTDAADTAS